MRLLLALILLLPVALQAAGLGVYNPAQHAVNGFMPTQLPGLVFWLDVQRAGDFADGTAIGTLRDFGGGGSDFTNATPSKMPTLKANQANGRRSLLFDGVDDWLINLKTNTFTEQCVVAVYKPTYPAPPSGNLYERIYSQSESGGRDFTSTNHYIPILRDGSKTGTNLWTSYQNSSPQPSVWFPSNTFVVFISQNTGTGIQNFANGNGSTNKPATWSATFVSSIICAELEFTNNVITPCAASVAEVIVLNKTVNSEKRLQVERYLGTKYGIVVQ